MLWNINNYLTIFDKKYYQMGNYYECLLYFSIILNC